MIYFPVLTSLRQSVDSADANVVPSGEKQTYETLVSLSNLLIYFSALISHRRIDLSLLADANMVPSGEKRTEDISLR